MLAGGAGRRFGRPKAALRLSAAGSEAAGPTLVGWAAAKLASLSPVDEVLVAAGNTEEPAVPGEVAETVLDGPGSGPAAGVLGAALARPGRTLLVLACDLPLVPVKLLAALASSSADLAAAAGDIADPWTMNLTCALWTPAALELLGARVEGGDFRLYPLTRDSRLRVDAIDAGDFGEPDQVLLNVNTADDWNEAGRLLEVWRR